MADLLSTIGQGLGAVGGPLVSGGLNLLGGLFQQGGQQSSIQSQENFQTQMSDTAYQRSVADMSKAGLNPALMYGSGGAESSPTGASMSPPNVLGGVASSAMDTLTAQKQMQVMDSQIANNLASAALTTNKSDISGIEAGLAKTGQSLVSGIENFVQGWGKTNASPGGLSNLTQSLGSKANNAIQNLRGSDNYSGSPNPPEDSLDSSIDSFENKLFN